MVVSTKIGAKLLLFLDIHKKSCTFAQEIVHFPDFSMDRQSFWRETKAGIILTNVLIAIAIAAVGVVVLQFCLKRYTEHGVEVEVPAITGLYIEEAQITLAAEDLHLEIIDSTYSTKTPLGTLVEQTPAAGSKVKHGRTVYAIRNARFRRPVTMPELRDVSLRQAQATVKSLGLNVEEVKYEPSAFKDIILDIQRDGESVPAGSTLPEGTSVTLVAGKGQGTAEVTVPSLSGKTLSEARSWLLASMLSVGIIEYDVPPTDDNQDQYVVYSQSPSSGTVVVEGSSVDLKMSTDIEKTVTADTEYDEEEFF